MHYRSPDGAFAALDAVAVELGGPCTYTALDYECFAKGSSIITLLENGASPSLPCLVAVLQSGARIPPEAIAALTQRLVLDFKLDLDQPVGGDAEGVPLLIYACRLGNAPAALTLLRLGASPTRAAAEEASRAGLVDVLSVILDRACPALDPAGLLAAFVTSTRTGLYASSARCVFVELLRRGAVATNATFEAACDKLNVAALDALLAGSSFTCAAMKGHLRTASERAALLSNLLGRVCERVPQKRVHFNSKVLATLRILMSAGATPSASNLHSLCSAVPVPADAILAILEAPGCRRPERFEAGLLLERVCRGTSTRTIVTASESDRTVDTLVRLLTDAAAAPPAGPGV